MMIDSTLNLGPGWVGGRDPSEMNEGEKIAAMLDSLVRFADLSAAAGEKQAELYAQTAEAMQKAQKLLDDYVTGHVRGNIVELYSEAFPMALRETIEDEFNRQHDIPDFSDRALPVIYNMDQKLVEICLAEDPADDALDERLRGISDSFKDGYEKWKAGYADKA